MLIIRQEQFSIFSRLAVRKFEDWMVVHLKKFFPAQCDAAGELRLRETIQHGIGRAATYGITDKRDVCKYIDLVVVLGRNFDTDKRLSWAGEILGRKKPPRWKIQALLQSARKHLRHPH